MADRRRPRRAAPDEEATARARAALLAHAAGEPPAWGRADARAGAPERRAAARRDPRPPAQGAPRTRVAAAVFAVAIVVVAGALPSGDGRPALADRRRAGARRGARWSGSPSGSRPRRRQPGDATLVSCARTTSRTRDDFTGADLYFDDGRYFYGITLAELEQNDDRHRRGRAELEREAAKAAISLPADQARRKMIDATFGPKGEPAAGRGVDKAAAAARDEKLKHMTGPTPTPAPKRDDRRQPRLDRRHGHADRRRRAMPTCARA